MRGRKLGPQGFPLTPSPSRAERKAFLRYQNNHPYPEMERRYLERISRTFRDHDEARLTAGATQVGAGRFHQLEAPEQINAMIERFLKAALRRGG
jgi:hypothetical protein